MKNSKGFSLLIPIFVVLIGAVIVVATIYIAKNNPNAFFPNMQQQTSQDENAGSGNSTGENPSGFMPSIQRFLDLADQKIHSIITPGPPLAGNLTVVRDLRGTWRSSLAGKGLQLYGKLSTGPGVTKIYEDGDIEMVIDSVSNNVATGKIRYTNLCANLQTTAPDTSPVNVRHCTKDTGYLPMAIEVSGTRLNFAAVSSGNTTFNMQGTYTTDLISGTMTMNLPPYGVLKGEFHLIRKQN